MKTTRILLVLIGIALSLRVNAQVILTLQPGPADGKDALLHGLITEITTNYGTTEQLPAIAGTVQGNYTPIRSVIEFDLSAIPAGAIIFSAELSLYAWNSSSGMGAHNTLSGANETDIQRITVPWLESTVTWDNQPLTTNVNQVTLPATSSPADNYLDVDVSDLVRDMITHGNYGFMLSQTIETPYRGMNFCSSDHPNASNRPKLVVNYSLMNITEEEGNSISTRLYPNPFQSETIIVFEECGSQHHQLEIFDMQGKLIRTSTDVQDGKAMVRREDLESGQYMFRVRSGSNQCASGTMIVQ